jgi:ribosomal protein L37E
MVLDEAWRALRRDSQILRWLLLASLPGIFVVFCWLLLVGAPRQSAVLPLVTFAFVAAIGVVGLRVARFACPRCGKPFFESWYFFQLLRRECAHCGLPRGSGAPRPSHPAKAG